MNDDTNPRTQAIGALAEMLFEAVTSASNFEEWESNSIDIGHGCLAEAMGLALEALDATLLANRPGNYRVHDIRSRTLATEVGDVSFSVRRYRDPFGCDVYLLADVLDIPYGCRLSPGASSFLVEAGSLMSYAKSARLLARHGSEVKPTTVMKCLRDTGELCAEEDEAAARSLYGEGVVPNAEDTRKSICVEADGTFFRVQHAPDGSPKRFEVKAMVAYEGKEAKGGKVHRKGCVHHALVGPSTKLWSEGVAALGTKYDLSKLEMVHLGADGEKWCRDIQRYLPKATVVAHLDPFHINRAILSCFDDPKTAWKVIDVLNDGDKDAALTLLKASAALGVARKKRTEMVIRYLEANKDMIALEGPSLGTMESDNQHLYGVRMDSFPCAWSVQGASDMARIISRRESKRPLPRKSRESSMSKKKRATREAKELEFYERAGFSAAVVKSVRSEYLPPHQVDTRMMESGKLYALCKGMAKTGRRI